MKFEQFEVLVADMRQGCMNRLGDMKTTSNVDEYNWYSETHNQLNARLMRLRVEYYNDES